MDRNSALASGGECTRREVTADGPPGQVPPRGDGPSGLPRSTRFIHGCRAVSTPPPGTRATAPVTCTR